MGIQWRTGRVAWVMILVASFGSVLGCGCGRGGGGGSETGSTLIYGRGGDANGLDPIHTDIGESVKVIVNIFDTLVAYDDDTLDLVPSLAESWTTSDDGKLWTFQLRPGVKFHDGNPCNAEAVVFTFGRILDSDHPHVHSHVIPYYTNFAVIERVEAVDDLTVEFHLKEPQAMFLAHMAMFPAAIVSPEAVKASGAGFTRNPVGTGPFQFVRWKTDQEIVLDRFDEHWRGPAGVARLIFLPINESSIRVQQLQRGEIHFADNLPPSEVDQLVGQPNIEVQETAGVNVAYLTMQNEKPPLDSKELRQAIWHAIDREHLVKIAYSGQAKVADTMVPPTIWGHHDALPKRDFDPDRARELVEQVAKDRDLKLPIKLELFVMDQPRPYMQQPRQTAIYLKDALEKVGFQIEIVTNDIRQHFFRMTRGEHQLGLAGWTADVIDPDNFLYTLLDQDNINDDGGNNHSRYRNQEVHDLLIAAQTELDQDRRIELYREAQEKIFEDAPVVPLVNTNVRMALRQELKGYRLHPSALMRLRQAHFGKD